MVTVVILEKRCQRIDCLKGKEQERQPPRGHTDREGRGNWNIHNHMGVKFRGGKFYCLDRLKRNSSNRVSQHGEGKATPAHFSALCHYQTICQKRRLRLILFTALLISDSSQSSAFDPHTSNHPHPHLAREETEALQSGVTHPGLPTWYGVAFTSENKSLASGTGLCACVSSFEPLTNLYWRGWGSSFPRWR